MPFQRENATTAKARISCPAGFFFHPFPFHLFASLHFVFQSLANPKPMIEELREKHTYGDVLVFPYDGGQHRTGTQEGPGFLLNTLEVKDVLKIEVDPGDGYKLKDADEPILRERPVGNEFMWNADSLKKNTRLLYDTTHSYKTTDCFGLFGDHSMEGGFFMGNQKRLRKLGFNHHLIMMDAHGDSHHPASSPSGFHFLFFFLFFLSFFLFLFLFSCFLVFFSFLVFFFLFFFSCFFCFFFFPFFFSFLLFPFPFPFPFPFLSSFLPFSFLLFLLPFFLFPLILSFFFGGAFFFFGFSFLFFFFSFLLFLFFFFSSFSSFLLPSFLYPLCLSFLFLGGSVFLGKQKNTS